MKPSSFIFRQIFLYDATTKQPRTDYEESEVHRLKDIPTSIVISCKKYVLSSAVIFIPPLEGNSVGYYCTFVHYNGSWDVYDDQRNAVCSFKPSSEFLIQCIIYVCPDNI